MAHLRSRISAPDCNPTIPRA